MASSRLVRSGAVAGVSLPETSAPHYSPFGPTLAPSFGGPSPTFGAANPSSETPVFQLPSHNMGVSHSGLNMLQAAQVVYPCSGTGMVQSVSLGGCAQMGLNMNPSCEGVGMVQSGSFVGNPLADPLLGMGQSSFFGGNHQAGVAHLGGSTPQAGAGVPFQPQWLSGSGVGETVNKNNNPFLF